jgi:hypothetical protein
MDQAARVHRGARRQPPQDGLTASSGGDTRHEGSVPLDRQKKDPAVAWGLAGSLKQRAAEHLNHNSRRDRRLMRSGNTSSRNVLRPTGGAGPAFGRDMPRREFIAALTCAAVGQWWQAGGSPSGCGALLAARHAQSVDTSASHVAGIIVTEDSASPSALSNSVAHRHRSCRSLCTRCCDRMTEPPCHLDNHRR